MSRIVLVLCVLTAPAALPAQVELFVTDYGENPAAGQKPRGASSGADPREARLFASIGEYEPFSFLLQPVEALSQVFITAGELKGPAGAVIPAANVTVQSVESFHGGGRDILVPVDHPWDMPAHIAKSFWCTVRVPDDARAGSYGGELSMSRNGHLTGRIRITLDVLPIRLADPPFALGLNYSKPDDDKDGRILAVHLADMREHGMTCVAPLYNWHQPVHDSDTSELGALLEAYKKAGFPGTFYWAPPMDLQLTDLAGYGDETNRRWQQKYIKVMRLMYEEVRKHEVPTLFSIGDELTNKGMEGVGIAGRLARFVWEELPEIATTSDMNGYREVMAMAPYLNVATFNNGWDGADHHNQGRRLLNRAFLEELQDKTGAIPWFVNAGSGRFPFGFFFWKMSKYGVRGKVEWYYNLRNERGSLVRTQGDAVYPTLDYERCREGIDDLKYLCKLESLLAKADPSRPEVKNARDLLKTIADGIVDDWTRYEGKAGLRFPEDGFARLDPEKVSAFGWLNALRLELANAIVALQAATDGR
ncbi:MAG: hypothetical protein JW955_07175 [Sedimentisphaerales bacterium]|nr:hypothetical protein [Sedimentisphaerales bacterium]